MINLNTCVKGQKLRLRSDQVVTYYGKDDDGRSDPYPHSAIAENGSCFTYTDEGHYHYHYNTPHYAPHLLDVVEILPLEAADSIKPNNDPPTPTAMINLNTCVHDQKLRLRDGLIVTYDRKRAVHPYPHCTRTESKECLTYTDEGIYHTSGYRSDLDVVEILPLETTDKHPSVAWWESCPWITDRKPTAEDGDIYGRVHIKANGTKAILTTSWDDVKDSEPWIHVWRWQPPALTDKEQALKLLDDHRDGWRPTPEQWHIIRKGLEAS